MNGKPNILLILTDQQRFDIVGVNGSRVCRTPHLDEFASQAANFQNAYSHCPLCTPTRASIYSGRAVHNHGLTRNIEPNTPNAVSIGTPEVPSIAQIIQPYGYKSTLLGKWHAGNRLPDNCGFDSMSVEGYGDVRNSNLYLRYLEERGLERPEVTPIGTGYPHNLLLAGVLSGPVEVSIPYFLAEKTIEALRNGMSNVEPFFISLNFWGPHAPYLPSEPYASMYDPRDIPMWENFVDEYDGKPPLYRRHHDSFVGEGKPTRSWEECARWAALYFGYMSQIDDQIGRVLNAVNDLGIVDETAVLISADHGDLCGSHGGMHDKNAFMVEELMHIPLMVRIPGMKSPGRRTNELASNLDIPATIVDLAGAEVPAYFDGRSLLPLMTAGSAARSIVDWPDYVVAECYGVHFSYETRMVVHDGHKYVFHPGAFDELYDLEHDSAELYNVIDAPAKTDVLRECRRRLLRWMQRTKDPMHRAFFLFGDGNAYGGDGPRNYGAQAGNIYFSRAPVLDGDTSTGLS